MATICSSPTVLLPPSMDRGMKIFYFGIIVPKVLTFTFPDQFSHAYEEKDQETPYVSIHASDIIL